MKLTLVGVSHHSAPIELREHGVASIPTSAFMHRSPAPPVLRFCFAKQDATLERAAERLCRV